MKITKDTSISLAGTIVFHVLLIVLLLVYVIPPTFSKRWSESLEGVPVMFGNIADALGNDEAFGRGNGGAVEQNTPLTPSPNEVETTPAKPAPNTAPATVATQDFEESIEVKAAKKADAERKRQDAIVAENTRKQKLEADRIAAEKAKQAQNINSQTAGLFGNGTGSGSRGNTSGTGTQGVPTGNASYGKTSGVGGWGNYDLGGRGVGRGGLVKPTYSANDYGIVVIDIIVDPKGKVVNADIGKGTNTPSAELKSEALKAALKTEFSASSKAGNQKGTITYKFNLN